MGELQRQLDYDSKLQQFLSVKGSVRVLAELEAREAAKRRAQRDREAAVQERLRDILKEIQVFINHQSTKNKRIYNFKHTGIQRRDRLRKTDRKIHKTRRRKLRTVQLRERSQSRTGSAGQQRGRAKDQHRYNDFN